MQVLLVVVFSEIKGLIGFDFRSYCAKAGGLQATFKLVSGSQNLGLFLS